MVDTVNIINTPRWSYSQQMINRLEMKIYKCWDVPRRVHSISVDLPDKMGANRTIFWVVAAVCLAQAMCGKLPRDAATEPSGNRVQLEDVIARAQAGLANASSQVAHLLGLDNLPDKEEVVRVLNAQSEILSTKIQEVIGQINSGTKERSASVSGVLDAISQRLNETVSSLQAQTPGVTKQASEIQEQISHSFSTFFEEAEKLAKAIGGEASSVQENLDTLTRSAVEQVVDIGKQVEQRIKTAILDNQTPTPHA